MWFPVASYQTLRGTRSPIAFSWNTKTVSLSTDNMWFWYVAVKKILTVVQMTDEPEDLMTALFWARWQVIFQVNLVISPFQHSDLRDVFEKELCLSLLALSSDPSSQDCTRWLFHHAINPARLEPLLHQCLLRVSVLAQPTVFDSRFLARCSPKWSEGCSSSIPKSQILTYKKEIHIWYYNSRSDYLRLNTYNNQWERADREASPTGRGDLLQLHMHGSRQSRTIPTRGRKYKIMPLVKWSIEK